MGMTSVRVPDEMLSRLKSAAARLRHSKGWIINDACGPDPSRQIVEMRPTAAGRLVPRVVVGLG